MIRSINSSGNIKWKKSTAVPSSATPDIGPARAVNGAMFRGSSFSFHNSSSSSLSVMSDRSSVATEETETSDSESLSSIPSSLSCLEATTANWSSSSKPINSLPSLSLSPAEAMKFQSQYLRWHSVKPYDVFGINSKLKLFSICWNTIAPPNNAITLLFIGSNNTGGSKSAIWHSWEMGSHACVQYLTIGAWRIKELSTVLLELI